MDRESSSLSSGDAGPPGYGTFPYAGLVRLLPGEDTVHLSVFVDRSIVEAFAMGGRATLTGRVYPSLSDSTNVGVFAEGGVRVGAEAWGMGPAFGA